MKHMRAFSRLALHLVLFFPLLCCVSPHVSAQPELVLPPIAQEMNINRLIECLQDPVTREEATGRITQLWLENRDNPRLVQPLLAALRIDNPGTRASVARLLGSLAKMLEDQQPIIEALLPVMSDQSPAVRQQAIKALGEIWRGYPEIIPSARRVGPPLKSAPDPRVVAQWAAALQDVDPGVRGAAAAALVCIGDARGAEPVLALLADKDVKKRGELLENLRGVRDERVVRAVIPLLRDPQLGVAAAGALCALNDPKHIDTLLETQQGCDAGVRARVVAIIGQIKAPRAVEVLASFVPDPDPKVHQLAVYAMAKQGDLRVLTPLTADLNSKSVPVRKAAVDALALLKDPRAIDLLLLAVKDTDHTVRMSALQKLQSCKDKRIIAPLGARIQTGDTNERQSIITILGDLRDPAAAPYLLRALLDKTPWLRQYIIGYLKGGCAPATVEPLLAPWNHANISTQRILVSLFPRYTDARAIAVVNSALKSTDAPLRQAALNALKQRVSSNEGKLDARYLPTLTSLLKGTDANTRTRAA
ncbi:MAG TPA: HEAT repeat domain-containing protein, partial [Armatimonadota bacterium]